MAPPDEGTLHLSADRFHLKADERIHDDEGWLNKGCLIATVAYGSELLRGFDFSEASGITKCFQRTLTTN